MGKVRTLGISAAMIGMILAGSVLPVQATELTDSGTLDMSTDYPGITMKAGENVNFDLDFTNGTGESCDASLEVSQIPEGWEGYFRGTSGQISKVHVGAGEETQEAAASFSLTLPDEVEEGVYTVVLEAQTDNGLSDEMELEITVSETETGSSSFTSEYPEQQAASGTSFTFDTTIVNNKGTAQTYSLSAEAPTGWMVTFVPSGESSQVASLPVEAGSSQGLTVTVTPPETLKEGEYTIPVSAISSGETLRTELKVTITGQYAVSVSTPSGNLSADVYANDEKAITLSVTNTGNVDLTNLNLTTSVPSDWESRFEESTIDTLEAGATKEVTVYVTPSSTAMTGDYVVSVTAENDVATSTADLRVSVKTRTSWGIFAIGVIVVLVAGLGFIFKKYGRR